MKAKVALHHSKRCFVPRNVLFPSFKFTCLTGWEDLIYGHSHFTLVVYMPTGVPSYTYRGDHDIQTSG